MRSCEEIWNDLGVPVGLLILVDSNPIAVCEAFEQSDPERNEVDDSHAPEVDEVPEDPQIRES